MLARHLLVTMLALSSVPCDASTTTSQTNNSTSSADHPPVASTGAWRPASGSNQVPIWPGNAPDGTFGPQPPESLQSYDDAGVAGGKSEVVLNIAVPTMTIMPAKARNTGMAVIVFPGGGFQELYMGVEGTEICEWLTSKGVTCIVLKYRVPGSDDFWDNKLKRDITPKIPRALQDAQRTIRLVRSKAKELGIGPSSHRRSGYVGRWLSCRADQQHPGLHLSPGRCRGQS